MQLNMGEGKSSFIVPIVAATLANGRHLPRVIVLPALAAQMFHILRRKLGGLLNRPIDSIPFSRSVQLSHTEAFTVRTIYQNCLRDKCFVLCQPEHILSFYLMGIEKSLVKPKDNVVEILVEKQQWIDQNTRNILDGSDEILDVKFELIYTVGLQNIVDFSPHRWTIIMSVLDILEHCLRDHLNKLQQLYPDGFKVGTIDGTKFPRFQTLQSDAGEMLLHTVMEEILNSGLPGFPLWTLDRDERNQLLKFISNIHQITPLSSPRLVAVFNSKQSYMTLLLLRGLFAHGVLQFVFEQKLWRVT